MRHLEAIRGYLEPVELGRRVRETAQPCGDCSELIAHHEASLGANHELVGRPGQAFDHGSHSQRVGLGRVDMVDAHVRPPLEAVGVQVLATHRDLVCTNALLLVMRSEEGLGLPYEGERRALVLFIVVSGVGAKSDVALISCHDDSRYARRQHGTRHVVLVIETVSRRLVGWI